MVKNIAREFDLAVQKKNVFYYLLGVVIVCVLGNIAVIAFRSIYGNNEGTYGYNILEYATWSFILPYLSCICIADTTFGSTHPNLLVKDGLTSDLSKKQIYLSKLFAAFILALTYVMFCIVVFLGVTAICHFSDGQMTAEAIRTFLEKLFLSMPLWMAGVGIAMMFLFVFTKKRYAYLMFFLCTLIIPQLIIFTAKEPMGLEACKLLRKGLMSYCFSLIPYPSNPDRNAYVIVAMGFIYAIISTMVGVTVFDKKKTD